MRLITNSSSLRTRPQLCLATGIGRVPSALRREQNEEDRVVASVACRNVMLQSAKLIVAVGIETLGQSPPSNSASLQ
jgi:hypothetical protein